MTSGLIASKRSIFGVPISSSSPLYQLPLGVGSPQSPGFSSRPTMAAAAAGSYTNWDASESVQIAATSNWWQLVTLAKLVTSLMAVDFSVVESRREGLAAIGTLLQTPDVQLAADTRFPTTLCVTDFDPVIARVLNNVSSALAYRDLQKDQSEPAKPQGGYESAKDKAVGAAYNDAHKNFVESRLTLKRHISSRVHIVSRTSFERQFSLTWS